MGMSTFHSIARPLFFLLTTMLIVVLTEPLSNSTGQLFVPRKNVVSRNSTQQLGQQNSSENTILSRNNINFTSNTVSHKINNFNAVNISNSSDISEELKLSIINHVFLTNSSSSESSKSKSKNSLVKLNNNNKIDKSKSKENMIYLPSKDWNDKQDSQSSINKYIKIFKPTLNKPSNSNNSNNLKPIKSKNGFIPISSTLQFTNAQVQKENTSNAYFNMSRNVSKEIILFGKPIQGYVPLNLKKIYKRHNVTRQQQRQELEDSTLFSVTEALNNRHLRKHGALARNDTLDKRPNTRSKKYTSASKFIEYLPKTPSVFLPAHGVGPLKKRTVVSLLGLFELSTRSGIRPEGKSELAAAKLAIKHINKQKLLPGYTLELLTNDTQVSFYFLYWQLCLF